MNAIHLNDQISFNITTDVAIHVDQLIKAEATVYAHVYGDQKSGFNLDIGDTDINWFLNDKPVKSDGFEELYVKLYGTKDLNDLITNVCTEAEKLVEGRVATSFSDLVKDQL